MRLSADHRLAILLHGGIQTATGKTGLALLRYSELPIVTVIDQDHPGQSLPELTGIQRQVPIVASVAEALPYQPNVLVIGIAPSGGALPEVWMQELQQALAAGLSLVNGLHTPLAEHPHLRSHLQPQQWIWDVRQEPPNLSVGQGKAATLACRRVLTVGTDMAIGKMSTCLELDRLSRRRGWRSMVLATGQTGLMLGHAGVALDAVRVDFAAGAIEQLLLRYGPEQDLVYIEGQGSLLHPGSTASLPLLRGSQPTHLILVHRAGQHQLHRLPQIPIPPLPKVIQVYETLAAAGGSFAPSPVVAIALNTHSLDEAAAQQAIDQTQQETGLPCTDPVRFGAELLLEAVLATPRSKPPAP